MSTGSGAAYFSSPAVSPAVSPVVSPSQAPAQVMTMTVTPQVNGKPSSSNNKRSLQIALERSETVEEPASTWFSLTTQEPLVRPCIEQPLPDSPGAGSISEMML